MKLSEFQGRKSQNLHFLRFLAAILVIFGHAFVLSDGNLEREWLVRLSAGQLNFGAMAVSVFFLAGGFLIAKSMERLKTAKAYFRARASRIFPPLFFVTAMVVFLGVFFSEYAPKQYFSMPGTWAYLLNGIFILVHNLPGVFTGNPYLPTVNGSLWTLPVEFLCYIACFAVYKLGCLNKKRFPVTIPLAVIAMAGVWWLGGRILILRSMVRPCSLFYIGMGYWVYRDKIDLRGTWAAAALFGFILTVVFGAAQLGMLVFFPYLVFTICFGVRYQVPAWLGTLGNYSYGIYLWGFPIQQAVVQCLGTPKMSPYVNMLIAVPIAAAFGIGTYLLTEKPTGKRMP